MKKIANESPRLSEDEAFRRDLLVKKIERVVEKMTLSELDALAYDLFAKGYEV